jgi:hypothetical protein
MRLSQIRITIFAALLLFAISGCSSKPTQSNEGGAPPETSKKKVAKPATPTDFVTGREGFQKLYATARGWAPDAQPVHLESRPRKEDPKNGTASVWSGTFASPSMRQIRSFLWSGASASDAPEAGITPGTPDTYSEGNISTRPFDLNFLKIDSDKAYAVAAKRKEAASLLKKSPDTPIKYTLYWDQSKGRLVWKIIFGGSEYDAKLIIWVNASTGEFAKVE